MIKQENLATAFCCTSRFAFRMTFRKYSILWPQIQTALKRYNYYHDYLCWNALKDEWHYQWHLFWI